MINFKEGVGLGQAQAGGKQLVRRLQPGGGVILLHYFPMGSMQIPLSHQAPYTATARKNRPFLIEDGQSN
jgi:hypothetical protein